MIKELLAQKRLEDWKHSDYRPRISESASCIRAGVYDRLGFQSEKEKPSAESIAIIEDGNLHEEDMVRKLERIGIRVTNRQELIEIPGRTHTGLIRGKTDGRLFLADQVINAAKALGVRLPEDMLPGTYLVELKSIGDYGFEILNSQPIRSHQLQTQLYLHKLLEMGIDKALVIYKCRETADIKWFLVRYDPELVAEAFKHFEDIERYASFGLLPARAASDSDKFPCSRCGFRKLCWEDFDTEIQSATAGVLEPEIAEKVARYQDLKEMISPLEAEKKKLSEEIKVWMQNNLVNYATADGYYVALKRYRMEERITPAHEEYRLTINPLRAEGEKRKTA